MTSATAVRRPLEPVLLGDATISMQKHRFDVTTRALVMGILNRTPDSFFDSGRYWAMDESLQRVEEMVAEGADIVDIGGVKAGPGEFVGEQEELDRVMPAVQAVTARFDVPVSIDTWRSSVAGSAVASGASLINDISGLMDDGMIPVAAASGAAVVICHIQGRPRVANPEPRYKDLRREVMEFMWERIGRCRSAGIDDDRIILDHGLDLGKSPAQSVELLAHTADLAATGLAVLLSASNKPFLGMLLDEPVDRRNPASLATAAVAVHQGARIVRVHDVAGTVRVVRTMAALLAASVPVAGAGCER